MSTRFAAWAAAAFGLGLFCAGDAAAEEKVEGSKPADTRVLEPEPKQKPEPKGKAPEEEPFFTIEVEEGRVNKSEKPSPVPSKPTDAKTADADDLGRVKVKLPPPEEQGEKPKQ